MEMSQQQQQQQSNQKQRTHQQIHSNQPDRNGQGQAAIPDPQVVLPGQHRRFSRAYKERILAEAERCTHRGELGALLRREGLYSSHLTRWRQQLQANELQPQKRGRKANPQAAELARLQRENERLKSQLERAELIIEAQKKLCQLLNLPPYLKDEPQ
jgi:transposase-like protein